MLVTYSVKKKPIILVDPFPRTMELIFSKDKLNYLNSKFKLIKRGKILEKDFYERNIENAKFIIGQPTLELSTLKKAKKLKAIFNVESNFLHNMDYDYCFKKNIYVLSTSPVFAQPVAEMSLGLLLSIARSIHIAHNDFINKKEKYGGEISQNNFLIKNKNFGFVGFGDLAKATLPIIKPFANKILAYDPWIANINIKSKNVYPVSLDNLLKNSDIIFVFATSTTSNKQMINFKNLNFIKDTSTILSGFTIQNGIGGNQYQNQDRGGGMLISNGNNGGATITNCLFTDNINANNGSHVKVGNGDPSTFINCSFKNGAPYTPIFTDNGSKGATFINCFIDADRAYGAVTSNGFPTFINSTVVNYTGVAYTSHGTGTAGIINSVFQPANGFPDAKVVHDEGVENIQITIDYSIFPEVGVNHSTETGSVTYGENNITGYPVFVDTTANNYRLGDLSPAISAGTSSFVLDGVAYNAPTNDLDGNTRPRPIGSNPDMGAYEFVFQAPSSFILYPQDSTVILTWENINVEGFQYYILERSTDETFLENLETFYSISNYYEDFDVDYGIEYFYRVYFLADDLSEYSEVISVTLEFLHVGHDLDLDPAGYRMDQNFPNPFNPITKIDYNLKESGNVNVKVFDVLGKNVKTLVQDFQNLGQHSVYWDATNQAGEPVTAGMYFYTIESKNFKQTKKMILLK